MYTKMSELVDSNHTGILFQFISENFVWFTIPFSVVISWILFTIERIGNEITNPHSEHEHTQM